jgi:hypothetical protein
MRNPQCLCGLAPRAHNAQDCMGCSKERDFWRNRPQISARTIAPTIIRADKGNLVQNILTASL